MRCINCKQKAVIRVKRHHSSFCKTHFNAFVVKQVQKNIKKFRMIAPTDKVMTCISGGKDSMVLWKILHDLGYETIGLYVDLGIDQYSVNSREKVVQFASQYGLNVEIVELEKDNISIPQLADTRKRPECSVCGIIKRYFFNKVAYDIKSDVIATGHNLDDESSRLLGNFMHWHTEHFAKQSPTIPSDDRMLKRKVKPLISLTEQEIAAYAFLNKIEYLHEECPMSVGATSMVFKEALNNMENKMPGTKQFFYFQFQKEKEKFVEESSNDLDELIPCAVCGFESFQETCGFCRLTQKDLNPEACDEIKN